MAGIAQNSIAFSSRQYFMLAFALVRNMVLAHILGQSNYNYWVLFQVFILYLDLSHLGLRLAASREIPILNGRGLQNEAKQLAGVIFGGIISLSVLSGLVLLVSGWIFGQGFIHLEQYDTEIISNGLYLSSVLLLSEQISRYFLILLRTRHHFIQISIIETSYDFIRTLLICVLAAYFSVLGAIGGYVVAVILLAVFFLVYERFPRPSFQFKAILAALSISIPLFFATISNILAMSVDRIVAAAVLSPDELSLYGFAVPIALLPVFALQSLRDVLFPSFGELSSTLTTDEKFKALYARAMRLSSALAPIMAAFMLIAIDPLVTFFVPQFQRSIDILFYIAGAAIVFGLGAIPNSILLVLRKQWLAFRISLYTALVFSAVALLLSQTGLRGISILIISVWLSFLFYSFFSIRSTLHLLPKALPPSSAQIAAGIMRAVSPVILGIVFVILVRVAIDLDWKMQYPIQVTILLVSVGTSIYLNKDLIPEITVIARRLVPALEKHSDTAAMDPREKRRKQN